MHLPLLFARRYLRSRKSFSVINTTTTVSSVALGVAVAAMVVLMSVVNGFNSLLNTIHDTTEADLVISPTRGATFPVEELPREVVESVEGVAACSYYLEESVMAEYDGRQMPATLRGVDEHYTQVVPLADSGMVWYGGWQLVHGERRKAVVGFDLDNLFADGYSVRNAALHGKLSVHALRRENISSLLPISAIRTVEVGHAGTLSDAATELTGHLFVSLDVAEELLSAKGRASAVAIRLIPGAKMARVQKELQGAVGEGFVVENRYQRNEVLYKAMRVEKVAIFTILLLVTLIAAVSVIGSLVMLVIEKRNDTATLYAIGARHSFVQRVFTLEGVLIGLRGAFWGMIGGLAVCFVQMQWGLVKMPGSTFLVENYPVEVHWGDIVVIVVAVVAVNYVITKLTVRRMVPKINKPDETRF
ncbi:MAG: ABC transporter permease [Tidjanibacter sp.]|nr:ABC transporter permease [Tidjanibacter sp.]